MAAIGSITQNQCDEYINMNINLPDIDFAVAKQAAGKRALEICSHTMILSWKNASHRAELYRLAPERKPVFGRKVAQMQRRRWMTLRLNTS